MLNKLVIHSYFVCLFLIYINKGQKLLKLFHGKLIIFYYQAIIVDLSVYTCYNYVAI